MKHISSRDNAFFKHLVALAQSSRERRKHAQTVLDGVHLIEAYRDALGSPRALAVSKSGAQNPEVQHLLQTLRPLDAVMLSDALFNEAAPVQTPTGVLAVIDTPPAPPLPERLPSCVLLHDLQDPGNLGAIIRTAAAAGIRHLLLSKGCAFAWAPRVVRAAMGGHFVLQIHEHQPLAEVMQRFDGSVIALAADAPRSVFDCDLTGEVAFLIGNEGAGLPETLLRAAGQRAKIPMLGAVESLNAAAAAAVCLFERVRQIQQKTGK